MMRLSSARTRRATLALAFTVEVVAAEVGESCVNAVALSVERTTLVCDKGLTSSSQDNIKISNL
jgi:hypothetical protein